MLRVASLLARSCEAVASERTDTLCDLGQLAKVEQGAARKLVMLWNASPASQTHEGSAEANPCMRFAARPLGLNPIDRSGSRRPLVCADSSKLPVVKPLTTIETFDACLRRSAMCLPFSKSGATTWNGYYYSSREWRVGPT